MPKDPQKKYQKLLKIIQYFHLILIIIIEFNAYCQKI